MTGKLKFVGFDAAPELIDNLHDGRVNALVAQNPVKIGYEDVKMAVDKIKGNTGVMVIDKSTLDSTDVQKPLSGK